MSKAHDIDIMTKTLWMEARGEPDIGIQAVACVIYNRFKNKKWYSKILGVASLANVCLKEWQFRAGTKATSVILNCPRQTKNRVPGRSVRRLRPWRQMGGYQILLTVPTIITQKQ